MPTLPLTPAARPHRRPHRAAPSLFRIALGAVVIDVPDENGVALVADVASGWAFQVSDGQGAPRHRDAGACAGGRDDAMRCALLSALRLVPRGAAIHLALDDGQDVRLLSQLIRRDSAVRAALAGRTRSAEVCPADRAVWQARLAAERIAEQRLRARATGMPTPPRHRRQRDGGPMLWPPGTAGQDPTRQIVPDVPVSASSPAVEWPAPALPAPPGEPANTGTVRVQQRPPAPPRAVAAASVQSWFLDLDASIAALRTGFREVRAASR